MSTFNADIRKEVPFKLFPRQIELLKSFVNHNNTIAIKHRQAGITTVASAWVAGQCVFASPDSPETVLCIGNKLDISEQLVDKIGKFLDQVPRWMWGSQYFSPNPDDKNFKSIYKSRNKQYIELFNGCKVYARSSGPNSARGVSAVSCLIIDECAFLEHAIESYTSATAATASVKDAKIILISTPNGKDELYYRTYHLAQNHLNNFNPVEFKWFQDLRYNRFLRWERKNPETGELEVIKEEVLDKNGTIPYNEEKWRKLEKDGWKPISPWYIDICNSFNNDKQKIAQEIEVSFLGSSNNVVEPEVIEEQKSRNSIEITEDWPLRDPMVDETWIWEDPIPGHRYVIACDPSSGSADDRTSIQVIDCDAIDENGTPYFNQVLEYNGKRVGDEVGYLVDRYGRIYNDAFAVVECIGGYGDAVVLYLMNNKYPNLYYDETDLKNYTKNDPNKRYSNSDEGKLAGFRTNAVRVQMLQNFASCLTNNSFRVRSLRVINELDTWIWKNGRPDHMNGFHDDSITCLAMGLFVMQFYMFKRLGDARKDAVILHSWKSGKSFKTEEEKNAGNLKTSLDISKPRNTQFFSSRSMDRKAASRQRAMLLLGGFKTKK